MHGAGRHQELYEEEVLLALDEGLLSSEEAAALREDALRLHRGPLELLKERGRLTENTLDLLRKDLARERTDRGGAPIQEAPTLSTAPPAATDADGAPAFPVPGWDRYEPVRFLGQGGMGQVFLAYDPLLRRNVALKFVRDGDPELARRFLSEARAQARVRHERVCEVYEVGEVRGQAFIAMRYVEGPSLGHLSNTLTLEQRVLVLAQAAEGVHAAHRAGLVHRDLKPGNILVERTEDGGFNPFVMDFGLARDWREEGHQANAVLGTPHYMPPEQARGEGHRLDRRADVYALGGTLYALLTGRPPFTGDTEAEVLTRLQREAPLAPRALDVNIPEDLEAIVLKCLEKERPLRYDSVRSLIDDLQRFLSGEPVRARHGARYWLRKKVRKHRAALMLGTGVVVVVAGALGQAALVRGEVAERERLARAFTERVERIESAVRYSALSRLHDTREDRQALRASMVALEADVRRAGAQAGGAGQYALGRALFALDDLDGAREKLEAAWANGYREPRVAWALAQVLGHLYRDQLLLDVERRAPEQREARRRELTRRYRDPALAYLRQAEGPDVPAPPEFVKALFAFYEDRPDEALSLLATPGMQLPWFYEAPLLRGDILLARAMQRWNGGDRAGSQADLALSREAYAAAVATAESQPGVHAVLGRLELAAMVMELYAEGNVLPHYERGLKALSRALVAAPDHARALVLVARFHRRLAEQRTNQGGEGVEALLEQSLAALRTAEAVAPPSARIPLELALTHRLWARYQQLHGVDPREQLRRATAAFERLRPEDRDYAFHANLGLTWQGQADAEDARGGDALPFQTKAIDAYLEALRLSEQEPYTWINLGVAYRKRANAANAPDAAGDLRKANNALTRALSLNPDNFSACFNGAEVAEQLARFHYLKGEDVSVDLERALSLYRQGLSLNAKQPALHNALGSAVFWQGELLAEEGGDPEALLAQARASFEQARTLAPTQGFAFNNLGEWEVFRAEGQLAKGQDPTVALRAAVGHYSAALERLPDDADFLANLGKAWVHQATWSLSREKDPAPELVRAEAALNRARELNPRLGNAWRYLAEAVGVRARWTAHGHGAADGGFTRAAQAFEEALKRDPRLEYRLAAADLHGAWAAWRLREGQDAAAGLTRGLELADAVVAARPRWVRAREVREELLRLRAGPGAPVKAHETE
ncbi:serine/threonine-protein kinase [Corallococcus praedator]|uniref:Serine/threonine-protein kinase n=1 Tax=Corallococcus praedator TaxID=2316724 RepID=A0ABX9QGR0_9BACT|nr:MULTISPECIES: serine/threonine-protein kinase [Corallococcus]RKH36185.1 serine/threonine-protein kinase [Corallococcus sp. CA031C]RKI06814.1 serine/threonine-protein kinase [Corallococcus praedator]